MNSLIQFRYDIIRHKDFFIALYKSKNSRKLIKTASLEKLQLFARLIFLITKGAITISKNSAQMLKKKRKLKSIMEHFDSEEKLDKFASHPLNQQREIFIHLKVVFPDLLYSLFNKL